MIARLDLAAIAELKEALPRFTHKPLAHLSYLRPDQVDGYWLDEIAQDLSDEFSVAFVSRNLKLIDGLALYADSSWDTKAVRRRIAVIKYIAAVDCRRDSELLHGLLGKVVQHAAKRGMDCLTCRVQALDCAAIHALERHGFRLMDTLLDFVFDSSRTPLGSIRVPKQPNGSRVRPAKPEDLPEILALTEKTFATYFGRYHSDPKMLPGTGAKVYDEWVRSSLEAGQTVSLLPRLMIELRVTRCGKSPLSWN